MAGVPLAPRECGKFGRLPLVVDAVQHAALDVSGDGEVPTGIIIECGAHQRERGRVSRAKRIDLNGGSLHRSCAGDAAAADLQTSRMIAIDGTKSSSCDRAVSHSHGCVTTRTNGMWRRVHKLARHHLHRRSLECHQGRTLAPMECAVMHSCIRLLHKPEAEARV
eukprot:scaffold16878_cov134-Isochrysis_galbana.AAC.3